MLKPEQCIRSYAHFQAPPPTFHGHKFNNPGDVTRTVASLLIDDSDEERGQRLSRGEPFVIRDTRDTRRPRDILSSSRDPGDSSLG